MVHALKIVEYTDTVALDIRWVGTITVTRQDAGNTDFACVGAKCGFVKIKVYTTHHRDDAEMLRHA